MKRNYYLFVGQNATTGTPNKKTGNYSYYGRVLVFKTKKDRTNFIDEKTGFSCQEKVISGGKKEMRSMNLGCSVTNFEEDLCNYDYTIKNSYGEWL